MKVSALRYRFDRLDCFDDYEKKIEQLVKKKKASDVDLILFPEYAGLELLSIFEDPLKDSYTKLQSIYPKYQELFIKLAQKHQVNICAGTTVVLEESKRFNRAHFFTKEGRLFTQDKCMSTQFEIEKEISKGTTFQVFQVDGVSVAIVICYDMEFPMIARSLAEKGAQLLLCPSYTDDWQGYYRVHVASRARALENQFFVATSVLHGEFDWVDEKACGYSGIYVPSDGDFPDSGILAQEEGDSEAVIDTNLVDFVREKGTVKLFKHWPEQFLLHFTD